MKIRTTHDLVCLGLSVWFVFSVCSTFRSCLRGAHKWSGFSVWVCLVSLSVWFVCSVYVVHLLYLFAYSAMSVWCSHHLHVPSVLHVRPICTWRPHVCPISVPPISIAEGVNSWFEKEEVKKVPCTTTDIKIRTTHDLVCQSFLVFP